jgi:metal-responsive CopG/Arc/MetJ family transcriptional regulator
MKQRKLGLTVYLPEDILDAIEEMAKKSEKSRNSVIVKILTDAMKCEEHKKE